MIHQRHRQVPPKQVWHGMYIIDGARAARLGVVAKKSLERDWTSLRLSMLCPSIDGIDRARRRVIGWSRAWSGGGSLALT
jgi:hypothetical protein